MNVMVVRRIPIPVILLAVVAVLSPFGFPTRADTPAAGTFSDLQSPSAETDAATAERPASQSPPATIGSTCYPDYWIVSSRHCPQGPSCCNSGCLEYLHITADRNTHRSDQSHFLASFAPGVPICIVAHGSFVSLPNVRFDANVTYRWIRGAAPQLPLHVVFYTWPSEAPITLIPTLDIAILGQRSEFNGIYLAELINSLPTTHPISLLGHSHGARVVSSALHLMAGGQVQGLCLERSSVPRRIRVAFAAAAIDHNWLDPGERYGRALCNVECLVNLRNKLDLPLAFYPLRALFSHRALARAGFTHNDYRRMGWLSAKLAEYDVSSLAGLGHMWPNYYRHPQIAVLLVPYLYFPDLYAHPEPKQ